MAALEAIEKLVGKEESIAGREGIALGEAASKDAEVLTKDLDESGKDFVANAVKKKASSVEKVTSDIFTVPGDAEYHLRDRLLKDKGAAEAARVAKAAGKDTAGVARQEVKSVVQNPQTVQAPDARAAERVEELHQKDLQLKAKQFELANKQIEHAEAGTKAAKSVERKSKGLIKRAAGDVVDSAKFVVKKPALAGALGIGAFETGALYSYERHHWDDVKSYSGIDSHGNITAEVEDQNGNKKPVYDTQLKDKAGEDKKEQVMKEVNEHRNEGRKAHECVKILKDHPFKTMAVGATIVVATKIGITAAPAYVTGLAFGSTMGGYLAAKAVSGVAGGTATAAGYGLGGALFIAGGAAAFHYTKPMDELANYFDGAKPFTSDEVREAFENTNAQKEGKPLPYPERAGLDGDKAKSSAAVQVEPNQSQFITPPMSPTALQAKAASVAKIVPKDNATPEQREQQLLAEVSAQDPSLGQGKTSVNSISK